MRTTIRWVIPKIAALALLAGPLALQAPASFNTSPNRPQRVSLQTFLAGGFTPVNGVLNSAYNTGGSHPVTGTMSSRVYKSGTTYAYLYQISMNHSVINVKNLILSYHVTPWNGTFLNFTLGNVGSNPAYHIDVTGNATNNTGFAIFNGLKKVDTAQGVDGQFLQANFVNSLSSGLVRGATSTILVVFTNQAPRVGNSHITVGGLATGSADVPAYAAVVPEPSSMAMLALGGIGLVGVPLWRRRRVQTA